MKTCRTWALLATVAGSCLGSALAQDAAHPAGTVPAGGPPPPPAKTLTLESALVLAQGAISACQAQGYTVSVSVVDSAGLAKVTLGADSVGRTLTTVRKAAAATAFEAAGSELEARAARDAQFAAKVAADNRYNIHAGSLPIRVGGEVVGGIGLSGAPTHEQDEACARSALLKYQGDLHVYTP
ncbi:MAG: heme-binding protein [Pseudoxanthomonas sp.]